MKWAITILMLLGLVAAVCVSVLINVIRAEKRPFQGEKSSVVEAVMVKEALPAMSVVAGRHLESREAPVEDLPHGYISSTYEAVGRVLAVPVVEGQILTKYHFVSEGTGTELAASLPHGMRAVSVEVPASSMMGGFLYPGCVVDIQASFRLGGAERGRGQALSTTLLHGIQVLAVENVSVVSKPEEEEESAFGGSGRSRARSVIVTLMVDSKQAQALQLARTHGNISLAMRNPLDRARVAADVTVLSEGRLAKLGSMLEPTVPGGEDERDKPAAAGESAAGFAEAGEGSSSMYVWRSDETGDTSSRSPQWPIIIIRGPETREEVLAIPDASAVVGR